MQPIRAEVNNAILTGKLDFKQEPSKNDQPPFAED
jgi:hypothetical protein